MQQSEISKIEEIIKNSIEKEADAAKLKLLEVIDNAASEAVSRINSVYTSAINTLRQLDLKDATIIDFFEKTKGNVRVYEHVVPEYHRQIEIDVGVGGRRLGYDQQTRERTVQPIQLTEGKVYKIILMAIEEELTNVPV